MAILQMEKINILALRKDRKYILETLQRQGVIEVKDMKIDKEDSIFNKEITSAEQSSYQKSADVAGDAANILDKYLKEKKPKFASFRGRKPLNKDEYYSFVHSSSEIMRIGYEILSLEKDINTEKANIVRYDTEIESLLPWKNLDVSISINGTKTTTAFVGCFSEKWNKEEILEKIRKTAGKESNCKPYIEIIHSDENQTCVFILISNSYKEELEDVLRKIGFIKPDIRTRQTATSKIQENKKNKELSKKLIKRKESEIKRYKGFKNALYFMEDYYLMRSERYEVIENLANSKNTFLLTGYIKKEDGKSIKKDITENFSAEVILKDATEEYVPVVLKNNKFTEPVESVLETYSLPKRSEVDPTNVMAIFYYIFFGMMFSDAGYGLVMSLVCGIALLKFKNMETGLKKSVKMFFFCGLSTIFWGMMFGSFFGNTISVVCETFLKMDPSAVPKIAGLTVPMWLDPGMDPVKMLMVSFLFGIIHLFTGLGMQGYMHLKNKDIKSFIYDVLSWYLLVTGAILALLSLDMMKDIAGFLLPSYFLKIGGIFALIGGIIIVFFSGRESTNPIKRLLKGIYELYGATGYLSDILSYSRLLALGLSTGVIAQVFNQIGSMFGGGAFGLILFTLIFIIGHSLNMGINALGAYVHTNRLQFVEFFGKFYEGGGIKFKPFKVNTKHYNIKEEV